MIKVFALCFLFGGMMAQSLALLLQSKNVLRQIAISLIQVSSYFILIYQYITNFQSVHLKLLLKGLIMLIKNLTARALASSLDRVDVAFAEC